MNVTFRLLMDIGIFPWYIVTILAIAMGGWLYLGYRTVLAFERFVEYYGRQRLETVRVLGQTTSQSSQVGSSAAEVNRSEPVVPPIPPEALIKRVKSAGFGGPSNG